MIARKTCRNKKGLIGHPFREYWKQDNKMVPVASHGSPVKTCTIDHSNRLLDIDGGALQRAVYTQDGVTDFLISGGDTTSTTSSRRGREDQEQPFTYSLTLETPIRSIELQKSADHEKQRSWWLQDGQSRMTILISTSQPGSVKLRLVKSGTVILTVSPSSLTRVRVISEDVDNFHKGANKRPTYFGKLLTDDFFHPLETYKVV